MSDSQIVPASDGVGAATLEQSEEPEYFKKFRELVDKRFEGVSTKMKEVVAPKTVQSSADSKPITREDISAALELGRVSAGLPVAAREKILALGEQGRSYSDQLEIARMVAEFSVAAGPAQISASQPIPHGGAASAAPRTSPAHPATVAEYKALIIAARKDSSARKRLDELHDDPAFDNTLLR